MRCAIDIGGTELKRRLKRTPVLRGPKTKHDDEILTLVAVEGEVEAVLTHSILVGLKRSVGGLAHDNKRTSLCQLD
jgi:hypothetical protein